MSAVVEAAPRAARRAVPSVDDQIPGRLIRVPLHSLVGDEPLAFPVYLETGVDQHVMYRHRDAEFGDEHLARLHVEGVRELFVLEADRRSYFQRAESNLDVVLLDRQLPVSRRAEVLLGVAEQVCEDMTTGSLDRTKLRRIGGMLASTGRLLTREDGAFAAIRALAEGGTELADHSLSVALLSMGLARRVLGADPSGLLQAGLAGMLHDIGRLEQSEYGEDHGHPRVGCELLSDLGVAGEVCRAVLHHHERLDGSGYPHALRGEEIPRLARIVGLVSTFDHLYTAAGSGALFHTLCSIADAYRGCFDEQMAGEFVRLFR